MSDPAGQRSAAADTERQESSADHLVAGVLADVRAGLAVGTFGAVAEFLATPGAEAAHTREGRTHTLSTAGGPRGSR